MAKKKGKKPIRPKGTTAGEKWGPADEQGVQHAKGNMVLATNALHKAASQRTDAEKLAVQSTRAERGLKKVKAHRTKKEQAAVEAYHAAHPTAASTVAAMKPDPAQLVAKAPPKEPVAKEIPVGARTISWADHMRPGNWSPPSGPPYNPWQGRIPGSQGAPPPSSPPVFQRPHIGSNYSQLSIRTRELLRQRFAQRTPGGSSGRY